MTDKVTIDRETLRQLYNELEMVEYEFDPPKRVLTLMDKLRAALAAHPAAQRSTLLQATAPREIWLQVSDEPRDRDEVFPADVDGITWCATSVLSEEVRYVRADLAAVPLTDEQIARHTLTAGECPPGSKVMLVSAFRRLIASGDKP